MPTGKVEFSQTCYKCGFVYPHNVTHYCPTVVSTTVPLEPFRGVQTIFTCEHGRGCAYCAQELHDLKAKIQKALDDAYWCLPHEILPFLRESLLDEDAEPNP